MVDLVPLAQAAQDADGVLDRGLGDEHRLEAPLERRILLDVLAVLVQGRRPDGVQLAAGEQRLEHVGGVDRTLGRARADHRVQLVDEEHDAALGVGDLLEHRLEPLLELAAVLGPGNEGPHVEGDQTLVVESLGDVAAYDALGQAFHDRGLADARLTDENRVVLGPAREHLDDPADLFVAADDRIELGAAGQRGQIAGVAFERLILPFGMLVGHPVRAADRGQRAVEPVLADPVFGQQAGRRGGALLGRQGQEEVLGADVLVGQALRLAARGGQDAVKAGGRGRGCAARRRRQPIQAGASGGGQGCRIHRELLQQRRHYAFMLLDQGQQQVLRLDLRMPPCSASCWAATTASWAFSVSRLMFMAMVLESSTACVLPCSRQTDQLAQMLQLPQEAAMPAAPAQRISAGERPEPLYRIRHREQVPHAGEVDPALVDQMLDERRRSICSSSRSACCRPCGRGAPVRDARTCGGSADACPAGAKPC